MKNRFSVDVTYFRKWFDRSLQNLADYKPDELARELARMSKAADPKVMLEREFNDEFINGVCSVLAHILDNGEQIPEHELQKIGSIVIENHGVDSVVVRRLFQDGSKTAFELLDAIGKKAGVEAGDVPGLIEWIDELPDPGKEKPTIERLAIECRASALRRKANGNMWIMMLERAEWLEEQDERMSKGGDTIPKSS